MESSPFFDSQPPPPPPLPSPNLFRPQPMQGLVHPRPSLEALEKELKEEKIKKEIIACRIAQRRMIEEQVRHEMDIEQEMMSQSFQKRASLPREDELDKSRKKPSTVQLWVKKTGETKSLNQKLTTTERMASATISETTILKFPRLEQNDWSCALCQVRTTSKGDLNSHLKGKKHLAQLALVKNNSGCTDSVSMPIVPTPKPKVMQVAIYREKKVNIEEKCNNKEELLKDMRYDNKPEAVDNDVVEVEKYQAKEVDKNWICDLCQVRTTSEDDLSNHLKGKKHLAQLALVKENSGCCGSLSMPIIPANRPKGLQVAMYKEKKVNPKAKCNDKQELLQDDSRNDREPQAVNSKAIKDNNGCNGSYLMPMDTEGKSKTSIAGEGNLSLVKREAPVEEKNNVKEVNTNTFCDICQVKLPGMGLNIHLKGRKHQAKYYQLSARNEFAKTTKVEDNGYNCSDLAKSSAEKDDNGRNDCVLMPLGAGGTKGGLAPALTKAEVPWSAGRDTPSDRDRVLKTVRGILNRLTAENFDLLMSQLVSAGITTSDILEDVVDLIFDKAVLEPTFCPIYAQLCSALSEKLPRFFYEDPVRGMTAITFRHLLLNNCQEAFEGAYIERTEVRKLVGLDQELETTQKERLGKLRALGNIRLIGELWKENLVPEKIIHHIIQQLLGDDGETCPDKESIEAICLLFNIIGKQLDENPKSCPFSNVYFSRLKELTKNPQLGQRLRFMVCNIVDLRANNWVPQHKQVKAKSISKIQNEAGKTLAMFPGTTACMRNAVQQQRFEIETPLVLVVVLLIYVAISFF